MSTQDDRRTRPRYPVHLAVTIDAENRSGRIGVSQDVSARGLRFNTRSRYAPGDELSLTLHLSDEPGRTIEARARVVRVETVESNSNFPWRYMTAVEFDDPVPHLESNAKLRSARET